MNALQKQERIKRAERHAEQDLLVAGTPKGCSVGCDAIDIQMARGVLVNDLVDQGCHQIVSEHDGTPEWLEHLRDAIFEGLPAEDRYWWHVELARSLPVTDDWQPYFHRICIRILDVTLENKGCWQDPYGSQVVAAVEQAIAYHRDPSESAARSAESAAWFAAWAAWSAAWSAAYKRIAEAVIEELRKHPL